MNEPIFIVIDLFCGFGGTTKGFALANFMGSNIAQVIACVNHDPKAIKSHWLNNPDVKHFEEDIRTLDLAELVSLAGLYRKKYPNAKLILWASLECTNFSKAKGGMPRNADSRTLADHLDRYIIALDPDYVKIENVVEFMSWGPLDEKGKPESKKSGSDWMRWRKHLKSFGYADDWKELNSANYGAYTSRNRLFGVFAKPELPIAWPSPSHAKVPSKLSMYGDLKKWMAVKEVLNFQDEGESVFTRKKPLSDNTLERIYAGLIKYIAKGDTAFISKYFSGKPAGKNITVDGPAGTVTTSANQALVQPEFLVKYNSRSKNGSYNPPSVDDPCPVVSTQNRLYLAQAEFIVQRHNGDPKSKLVDIDGPARTLTSTGGNQDLVQPAFLAHYYSGGGQTSPIDVPCPTVTAMDGKALVQPEYFIDKHFGKSQNQSIDVPAGTIMPTDKHRLVTTEPFIMPTAYQNQPKSIEEPAPAITASRRHHYLINPSWGGNPGSVEEPCCVVIARQDKAPLYFVQVEEGPVSIAVFDNDTAISVKIKQFMAAYGLVDIKMRMLRVPELLKIQGFPEDYKMVGNQSDQKKFIGNSVVPHVVKAWAEAMAMKLIESRQKVA